MEEDAGCPVSPRAVEERPVQLPGERSALVMASRGVVSMTSVSPTTT